jgi:hypothetical protein
MLWYTREASVAVYVANLPLIWPLLREWFPILRNATTIQSTPLPTIEPPSSNKKIHGRVMSMDAYHKGSGDNMSTRTLTCESTSEARDVDGSFIEEDGMRSGSVMSETSRSMSRGRTRTKSPVPGPQSHASITSHGTQRLSGESYWDNSITAETKIQVDEHPKLADSRQNSVEERSKFMIFPPLSHRSETNQDRRMDGQATVFPPAFASEHRNQKHTNGPSMPIFAQVCW